MRVRRALGGNGQPVKLARQAYGKKSQISMTSCTSPRALFQRLAAIKRDEDGEAFLVFAAQMAEPANQLAPGWVPVRPAIARRRCVHCPARHRSPLASLRATWPTSEPSMGVVTASPASASKGLIKPHGGKGRSGRVREVLRVG